jgi:hypothetical protein
MLVESDLLNKLLFAFVYLYYYKHQQLSMYGITVLVQPGAPVSAASVNVAVNPVEQLSLTVGAPTAASICAWVGLQGIAPIVPSVNVGGVRSLE